MKRPNLLDKATEGSRIRGRPNQHQIDSTKKAMAFSLQDLIKTYMEQDILEAIKSQDCYKSEVTWEHMAHKTMQPDSQNKMHSRFIALFLRDRAYSK